MARDVGCKATTLERDPVGIVWGAETSQAEKRASKVIPGQGHPLGLGSPGTERGCGAPPLHAQVSCYSHED